MPKLKTCKSCKGKFEPTQFAQVVCDYKCGLRHVEAQRRKKKAKEDKEDRKDLRRRKEALKTKGEYLKEAQIVFNKFIRLRDNKEPCISCQKFTNDKGLTTGSRWDCGHYKSRGAHPELRFEELNCAKQCVKCNRELSGNIVSYRMNLINKIGIEKLDWLEGNHKPTNYTIEDVKEIKKKYAKKARELEKLLTV